MWEIDFEYDSNNQGTFRSIYKVYDINVSIVVRIELYELGTSIFNF